MSAGVRMEKVGLEESFCCGEGVAEIRVEDDAFHSGVNVRRDNAK